MNKISVSYLRAVSTHDSVQTIYFLTDLCFFFNQTSFTVVIKACSLWHGLSSWKFLFCFALCVYINEAKIGTINRKRYKVDVLFLFFSTCTSHWVSDFCMFGSMETLVHLPSAVTENKYDFSILIWDKYFVFVAF